MRAHNERALLTLLREDGPTAKADIARKTGLSAQAVSNIMRALESDGLIVKGEPQRGKVGQPSVPMRLAADGAYFLGLKIGRRTTEMVLTDFLGRVLERTQIAYRYPSPEAVVAFTRDSTAKLLDRIAPEQIGRLGGLGIAMPFRLWDWAEQIGVEPQLMAAWRDFDIVKALTPHLDCPIYLENDASAACNAELVFGAGDVPESFLYFYVGYFIGGGLVLQGRLFTGDFGNAAAFGSMPVPDGQGGICQLIDRASLAQLEARIDAAGHPTDRLWQSPSAWAYDDALLDGWVSDAARALAFATVSATAVVDISEVMIDGWLPDWVRNRLVTTVKAGMDQIDLSGLNPPVIRPGTIGVDARTLGASSLPLSARYLLDKRPA